MERAKMLREYWVILSVCIAIILTIIFPPFMISILWNCICIVLILNRIPIIKKLRAEEPQHFSNVLLSIVSGLVVALLTSFIDLKLPGISAVVADVFMIQPATTGILGGIWIIIIAALTLGTAILFAIEFLWKVTYVRRGTRGR